jgi:cyclase
MLLKRVIPTLLLKKQSLVKTVKFKNAHYIGDPINTVRIFNELEVDEICLLDITASKERRDPNYRMLSEIADECFMPLSYGGGITAFEQAKQVLGIGFEKVVINSSAFTHPKLIPEVVKTFGSQSVIGSVDVKKTFFGGKKVFSRSGTKNENRKVLDWCRQLEQMGVGEILLTSIDHEGTWEGYDIDLIKIITNELKVPVIASGGAGKINDIEEVVKSGGASGAAVGSMVVYQKKDCGVLINFPDKRELGGRLN